MIIFNLDVFPPAEGVDYLHGEGEITIPPTEVRTCIPVSIVDDNIYKSGRRFHYTVRSHDTRVIIRNNTGVAMIQDNDEGSVEVGFDRDTYTVVEGESVEVCVWMTAGRVGQPFVVNATTVLTSSISSRKSRTVYRSLLVPLLVCAAVMYP